jgi:hypothetical protein
MQWQMFVEVDGKREFLVYSMFLISCWCYGRGILNTLRRFLMRMFKRTTTKDDIAPADILALRSPDIWYLGAKVSCRQCVWTPHSCPFISHSVF